MKRFTEFLNEQDDQGAIDKAKYAEMPPNRMKNYQDRANDIFMAIFSRHPVESLDFLEKFASNEDKESIKSIRYEMDQTNKNPIQDGLGYAIPNK